MPEALNHIGLVADGDDIYVVGGHGNRLYGGDVRNSLFRYSVAEDRWTRLADMPTAPRGAGGRDHRGQALRGGRYDERAPLGHAVRTLEVYDIAPTAGRGPGHADRPRAHRRHGPRRPLYVLGGRDARSDALGTATRFHRSRASGSLPPLAWRPADWRPSTRTAPC